MEKKVIEIVCEIAKFTYIKLNSCSLCAMCFLMFKTGKLIYPTFDPSYALKGFFFSIHTKLVNFFYSSLNGFAFILRYLGLKINVCWKLKAKATIRYLLYNYYILKFWNWILWNAVWKWKKFFVCCVKLQSTINNMNWKLKQVNVFFS